MNQPEELGVDKQKSLSIPQIEPEAIFAQLQVQLQDVQKAVVRLEEAKIVSQETMLLEVSI